jgi:hypothetical protein
VYFKKKYGLCSSSTAYSAQFLGSTADFDWTQLWRAKIENKTKFFCWLPIQNKLWTADCILKHGGQANPTCQLCRTTMKSVIHMLTECSFSASVWQGLESWVGVAFQQPPAGNYQRFKSWWSSMIHSGVQGKRQVQERMQKVIYVVWNLWKERCRQSFRQSSDVS